MASSDWNSIFAFPFSRQIRGEQLTVLPDLAPKKRKSGDQSDESSSSNEEDAVDTATEEHTSGQRKRALTPREIRRELATLNPPLYLPLTKTERRGGAQSLKQNHVKVLVALMHRCLRTGDFARAGRAWGMLLRTHYAHTPIDLRLRGLYGIGAEILLRQGSTSRSDGLQDQAGSMADQPLNFSRQGFEAAKVYYERLAIEYPYRHWHSNSISSLDFYLIMYGLWIASVQDTYRQARKTASEQWRESSHNEGMNVSSTAPQSDESVTQARETTINEIGAIETSMAELMIAPPHSESEDLKELRSMVGQWKRDLQPRSSPDESRGSSEIRGSSLES
jgi:RNA polymerase I specific initiation factor